MGKIMKSVSNFLRKNTTNAIVMITILTILITTNTIELGGVVNIDTNLTISNILSILTTYMILILVIERLAEVLVTGPREFRKMLMLKRLDVAQKELMNGNSNNYKKVKKLNDKIHIYRDKTRKATLMVNFIFGFLLAFSGFRLLNILVLDIESLNNIQISLFTSIDILLTAGLIAGGSKGMNLVSKSLRDWFNWNVNKEDKLGFKRSNL